MTGVDTHEMMLIHRVIRREIGQLPALFRGAANDHAVGAVSAELPAWTASADPAAGERMAVLVEEAMPSLVEHLAEEEEKILPIVSVTITQQEWKHSASTA